MSERSEINAVWLLLATVAIAVAALLTTARRHDDRMAVECAQLRAVSDETIRECLPYPGATP